jgi:peroxiredoxin
VGVFAAMVLLACSGEPQGGAGSTAGEAAPAFTLPDLSGNPVSLSDFHGQTVVLDFWATWCLPCVFQVPELNKLWAAHKELGDVVVIGVAVDVEGAEVVAPWAEEQGVDYTLVIGDEDLARDFGVMGFPSLVIIKPDGRVDSRHVGLIELNQLEALVAAARATRST